MTRDAAIAHATQHFDSGAFRDHLAQLVAIPSTSQDPAHAADTYIARLIAQGIADRKSTMPILANVLNFEAESCFQPPNNSMGAFDPNGHGPNFGHITA